MLKYKLLILFLLSIVCVQAQEMNARVQILAPKVSNISKTKLDAIQNSIRNILNNTQWTNETYQTAERIECNFVITIASWDGNSSFNAEAQIQSSRPVYGSSYSTTLLNINDKDFVFNFTEGQSIETSNQTFISNLSSLLSFYAYTIIGLDKDSFGKLAGTTYYQNAQNIVNLAQSSGNKGWRAADGLKSRYWLNENLLSPSFKALRNFIYDYHLNGLDKLQNNYNSGLKNILSALNDLKSFDQQKLGSIFPNIYFAAKADEITNIIKLSTNQKDKNSAYNLLAEIDPANNSKYKKIKD